MSDDHVGRARAVVPALVPNTIAGSAVPASSGATVEKRSPHDARLLWHVAASGAADVDAAVAVAVTAQRSWADLPGPARGAVLHEISNALDRRAADVAAVVAAETGKSPRDALGEVGAAVACGRFFAGEGQRLYGRTTTSSVPGRQAMTVRAPVGVAGLIIAANTPIANVAWKVFPALICGNAAVLKAAEDAPATAWLFGEIAAEAGLPPGVLDVVQGVGRDAGAPLVRHPDVGVVSFTGSTAVGREIAVAAGERLAKVSLELGGKNAFVVCADADLDAAAGWALLSAFSNAGQRCASGSRLLVDGAVYDDFRARLVARTEALRLGPTDDDDLGPVINERALRRLVDAVERARADGVGVLCGGGRLHDDAHPGWYFEATILEGASLDDPVSVEELFGPLTVLYRTEGLDDAIAAANASPFGLTACVHTRSWDAAWQFVNRVSAGVAVVNGGTHGSEPHMPFGGVRASGNGSREPGTEALDVYSELKDLYFHLDPGSDP